MTIEDVLELLLALWTFVSDVCILLWSSLWTVWTYLPFERFRNELPALSDQILELLLALWTFVYNVCSLLWSYASKALWAMWAYPPFETFRNELPALSNRILLALWTFVSNVCILLWSSFWTVWTYPPFETFRSGLVAALFYLKDYAVAHPFTIMAVVLAIVAVPMVLNALWTLWTLLLNCLGFSQRGVQRGSYAARYQAMRYGGNVPKTSTFAVLQAHGMRG